MSNRLAHETSPYLKQHENNPVDWYPWGAEALARAKAEDRPTLPAALADAYATDKEHVIGNARQFKEGLARVAKWGRGDDPLRTDTVDRAATKLEMRIDPVKGGFEGAPKFPNASAMELILRG